MIEGLTSTNQSKQNKRSSTDPNTTQLANPTLSPPLASRRQKGREDTYSNSGGSSGVVTGTLLVGLCSWDGLLLRLGPPIALLVQPFCLWVMFTSDPLDMFSPKVLKICLSRRRVSLEATWVWYCPFACIQNNIFILFFSRLAQEGSEVGGM